MSGPEQTPQKPDDRELEDFLAGRGKVREVYRTNAQEQSPAAVDEAILRMSEQALAAPVAVVAKKPRALRPWNTSLAAAAVLVLSLGVFLQVRQDPVAERAVFALSTNEATQDIAAAQPEPASSQAQQQLELPAAVQLAQARAKVEQAQRQRTEMKSEMKKEMAAASAAIAMAAPAAEPMAAAAPEVQADMAPPLAKASSESERQHFALQDSVSPKPAPPPSPPTAMAGKMLRAAPERSPLSVSPAPTIEVEPAAGLAGQDLWAQTCSSDMAFNAPSADKLVTFKTTQQWKGLSVVAFGAGALVFAPDVSREAVLQQLDMAQDAAAACVEPAQKGLGARLLCRCVKP